MPKKTPEQISYNMKQVCNKDSKIEMFLRKELWRRGMQYRKNDIKSWARKRFVKSCCLSLMCIIPETSCEEFNVFLDRGVVIGTFDNPEIGFFKIQ